jgi:hypothetical protein
MPKIIGMNKNNIHIETKFVKESDNQVTMTLQSKADISLIIEDEFFAVDTKEGFLIEPRLKEMIFEFGEEGLAKFVNNLIIILNEMKSQRELAEIFNTQNTNHHEK